MTRDNIKREIRALNSLGDEIGCEKRTVITWTGGEGAGKDIEVMPLWKFLLE